MVRPFVRFIVLLALAVPASSARAQAPKVAGTYATAFEKVIDNCGKRGMKLSSEALRITQKKGGIRVKIASLPPPCPASSDAAASCAPSSSAVPRTQPICRRATA